MLHGSRQVVFVGGEPGAGKSRLVGEVCRIVHRSGAAVLVGACREAVGSVYQPFAAIAGALLPGVVDGSIEAAAEEPWDRADDIERRVRLLAGAEVVGPALVLHDRRELFDAFETVLAAAATDRPTVLGLEDLHWAGLASIQLLGHLVEHTAEARLLVLAAHRTTRPDGSEPLLQEIAALHRLPWSAPPRPSTARHRGRRGVPASRGRGSPPPCGTCRGHPARPHRRQPLLPPWLPRRDLEARGGLAAVGADTSSAPNVVRDTIRRRLAGMTDAHRDVVSLAAVSGEVVDVALVRDAGGADDVHPALDQLVAMGLIEQLPHAATRVRFVHALARQSVLDLLAPSVRARLHERLALTLRARGGTDAGHVERLAHHFAEAAGLGHGATAVSYLVEAGEASRPDGSPTRRRRLGSSGRHSSANTTSTREALAGACRAQPHVGRASSPRAQALGAEVARSADPVMPWSAGAAAFEDASWYTGMSGIESLEVLRDALSGVDIDRDDPVHVRALGAVSRALAYSGSPQEAESVAAEVLELARRAGDAGAAGGRAVLHAAHRERAVLVGPAAATVPGSLTQLAVRTRAWRHLGPAAYTRSVLAYETGDPDELPRARVDLDRTARVSGQRYWAWTARCAEYGQLLAAGDLGAAADACYELSKLGSTFGADQVEGAHGVQTFMVRREAGHLGVARALLDGHEPLEEYWAPALLALYVELGMAAPARRVIDAILSSDLEPLRASARWPETLAFLSEAVAAHGDRTSRGVVRDLLAEHSGRNLLMGPFIGVFGAADRHIAVLDSLLRQGDPDASFAAALDLDRRWAPACTRPTPWPTGHATCAGLGHGTHRPGPWWLPRAPSPSPPGWCGCSPISAGTRPRHRSRPASPPESCRCSGSSSRAAATRSSHRGWPSARTPRPTTCAASWRRRAARTAPRQPCSRPTTA